MKASALASILKAKRSSVALPEEEVAHLLTDSRKLADPQGVVFFAIPTKRNSGCRYVDELHTSGVRNFVVPEDSDLVLPDANIWYVADVVTALQMLATAHRAQFGIPVIGITGSNGKTVVKDWIVQLLSKDRRIVSSPKSYNSQIGVPLSVWQLSQEADMAVFEAGISESGEMDRLRTVINPTIGIITNIGQAHDEHFLTRQQKIAEKLKLFTHCDTLIYCTDHKEIHNAVSSIEGFRNIRRFTWGSSPDNDVQLVDVQVNDRSTTLAYNAGGVGAACIPFTDQASIENAMHCIALMVYLGYDGREISERTPRLTPVEMRLEMIDAIGNCLLINDSYSLDLNSLAIALDFLQHDHRHYNKTVILSDFFQTGMLDSELYSQVASLLEQRGVTRLVAIGQALGRQRACFERLDATYFPTTHDFIQSFDFNSFQNETILLKGARSFGFEAIARRLQRKTHETVMEVNLDAMVHNLNFFRSRLKPTTKLMAMVKASSYGAGKVEVANTLQFNGVDYLTVAYADEGVELRRNGITVPIMVMNPEEAAFDDIIKYRLEPDIYSFRIFDSLLRRAEAGGDRIGVHIELDTGMHRLGFGEGDIEELAQRVNGQEALSVRSIFSHLACSDDPAMDDFTKRQLSRFVAWADRLDGLLEKRGEGKILHHILNSSGIVCYPEAQLDMVRLGIGLYGVAPQAEVQRQLRQVSRLVTRISQLKDIPQGDTVGYNCRWVAQRPSRIAIIPIGYADGFSRQLGYGRGRVLVGDMEAPVIGSVCMDMCFVDVTEVPCEEGQQVVVFGEGDLLQRNADAAGTIPYELLTAVSPRVKRVYYQE
ncbi:MAG: bifunctional UDP-N-acetylmuramoyl-tripeptide:D-alanyl-D-alanine ligase/alanine racemase [Bacteroidales bacterium]|nr:bifunctional UDP-N-acetylmuramoyl-tripeptide:D-alanyl-D-alanine ligase/alanine racemase [Bacteroidales bacterium]